MAAFLNGLTGAIPSSGSKPIQLSFPIQDALTTRINLHLTNNANSLLVFLTTSTAESAPGGAAPMGSLIYAMPNLANPSALPLTTPLLPHASTQDFATRVSIALARKVKKPVYVGSSISFSSAALGGTVEEEMRGLARCVEVVVGVVEGRLAQSDSPV